MPKIVFLWTDVVVLLLIAALAFYIWRVRRSPNLRTTWHKVMRDPAALCSMVILIVFLCIAVVDSLHYRSALAAAAGSTGQQQAYSTRTESLLDAILAGQVAGRETSYSAPMATRGFTKDTREVDGKPQRIYPRLVFGGAHLKDDATEYAGDVTRRVLAGLVVGVLIAAAIAALFAWGVARRTASSFGAGWRLIMNNQTELPLRAALITVLAVCAVFGPVFALAGHYHVFGTDDSVV